MKEREKQKGGKDGQGGKRGAPAPHGAKKLTRLVVLVQLQLSFSAIFESGHMHLSSDPKWSAKATGKLCSTTAEASSISALVTWRSSFP